MLRLAKHFWDDQTGFVVSAELVLISTVGVIGLVTGLTCVRNAVNDELTDVSCAIKSLDQSYCYTGFHSYKDKCSCVTKARTAGSTNVYTSYEPDLVPVEEVAVEREPIRSEILSERVISEHIVEGQAIEQTVPCQTCPTPVEGAPVPKTPAANATPEAVPAPAVPGPTPAEPAPAQ